MFDTNPVGYVDAAMAVCAVVYTMTPHRSVVGGQHVAVCAVVGMMHVVEMADFN